MRSHLRSLVRLAFALPAILSSSVAFGKDFKALYDGETFTPNDSLVCSKDPSSHLHAKLSNNGDFQILDKQNKVTWSARVNKNYFADNYGWAGDSLENAAYRIAFANRTELDLFLSGTVKHENGDTEKFGPESVWSCKFSEPENGSVPGLFLDRSGSLKIKSIKKSDMNKDKPNGRELLTIAK